MTGLKLSGTFSRISSFMWALLDLIFVSTFLFAYAVCYALGAAMRGILSVLDYFKACFLRSAACSCGGC